MNAYTRSLEDELAQLRARRVQLRRAIKFRAGPMSGDPIDSRNAMEFCLRELRSSERRWAELHHLLGRTMPSPRPVKLIPGAARAMASRAAATPARRRVVPGYVTKVMVPDR